MKAWVIVNAVIHRATIRVLDWGTELAIVDKCCQGKSYEGHTISRAMWAITLDLAKIRAREQVEKIYKNLGHDPMLQSTWLPYLEAVRRGEPNIHDDPVV